MTARQSYRQQKGKSPSVGRWLKWAKLRYLPARHERSGAVMLIVGAETGQGSIVNEKPYRNTPKSNLAPPSANAGHIPLA